MVSWIRQTMLSKRVRLGDMTPPSPRQRITDAALAIVLEGGFDALQVRAVTERAGVSSRTIYTLFPSLESLLITAIAERSGKELYRTAAQTGSRKRSGAARVRAVIDDLIRIMTDNRTLTIGLLRALLSGKPDVAEHMRRFARINQALLAHAINPDGPTANDRESARLLEAIYFDRAYWMGGGRRQRRRTANDHATGHCSDLAGSQSDPERSSADHGIGSFARLGETRVDDGRRSWSDLTLQAPRRERACCPPVESAPRHREDSRRGAEGPPRTPRRTGGPNHPLAFHRLSGRRADRRRSTGPGRTRRCALVRARPRAHRLANRGGFGPRPVRIFSDRSVPPQSSRTIRRTI